MKTPEDLTNKEFGYLTAIKKVPHPTKPNWTIWECLCRCGNTKLALTNHLKDRADKNLSCGCLNQKIKSERLKKHGMALTPTYNTWHSMRGRCLNPKDKHYHLYGGRGIQICERWLNSIEAFIEDMGERPEGTTLDRIDLNGNYEPGNCRWASLEEQANNKSTNVFLTHEGKTQTISQWGREVELSDAVIRERLDRGWSVEKALYTPTSKFKRMLTYNGETKALSEWAKIYNLIPETISERLKRGWVLDRALNTPIK